MPTFDRTHALEARTDDLLKLNNEVARQLKQALEIMNVQKLALEASNRIHETTIATLKRHEERITALEKARTMPWELLR